MAEMKHPESPIHILLGGGIGSGKSVAGRRFRDLGAVVVEADRLGHELLEPGGESFGTVSGRWPSVVVAGRIDRGALAEIVFADREELAELETMTHPLIIRRVMDIARNAGSVVVEIPLILDVPGEWVKVYIDADEDLRLRRVVERGHIAEDARSRMTSQPTRGEWLAWADYSIENFGAIEEFESRIDSFWHGVRNKS